MKLFFTWTDENWAFLHRISRVSNVQEDLIEGGRVRGGPVLQGNLDLSLCNLKTKSGRPVSSNTVREAESSQEQEVHDARVITEASLTTPRYSHDQRTSRAFGTDTVHEDPQLALIRRRVILDVGVEVFMFWLGVSLLSAGVMLEECFSRGYFSNKEYVNTTFIFNFLMAYLPLVFMSTFIPQARAVIFSIVSICAFNDAFYNNFSHTVTPDNLYTAVLSSIKRMYGLRLPHRFRCLPSDTTLYARAYCVYKLWTEVVKGTQTFSSRPPDKPLSIEGIVKGILPGGPASPPSML